MKKRTMDTNRLVMLALFTAIIILLAVTPLGLIRLPLISATTIHIPVIVGAILLGPKAGAFLGGVFGLCSMVKSTVEATATAFLFSPFHRPPGVTNETVPQALTRVITVLWIAIGCRIMIGVVSGWLWIAIRKWGLDEKVEKGIFAIFRLFRADGWLKKHNFHFDKWASLSVVGFIGSMTNTLLVMGSIYFFLGPEYAAVTESDPSAVGTVVLGVIAGNGIPEAIAALVIVAAVTKALLTYSRKNTALKNVVQPSAR